MGLDLGASDDRVFSRKEVDLLASTGLKFDNDQLISLTNGKKFSRFQLMFTGIHRGLFGTGAQLASRHVGFWSTSTVPDYLAYRVGGRFYVRGFDEPDFSPFKAILGGTTEIRAPIVLPTGNIINIRSKGASPSSGLPLTGVAFLDYAMGGELDGSSKAKDYVSIGVGLRLGPIKIDYAVNNRRESKVHMSLVDPTF